MERSRDKTRNSDMAATNDYEFSELIEFTLTKVDCPVAIAVTKAQMRGLSRTKNKMKGKMSTVLTSEVLDEVISREVVETDPNTLVLHVINDVFSNMTEITMKKFRFVTIPRIVMQILAAILPYFPWTKKFTLSDCSVDQNIIYELNNILKVTNLTDICLESLFVPEGNYYILLQEVTTLRNLTISRCKINDTVCSLIIAEMQYKRPGDKIMTLNLSSNLISDVSAKDIGELLRVNRNLRYLNLADNRITDVGADYIFSSLKEFPLNTEEVYNKRRVYMNYLLNLRALYKRCSISENKPPESPAKKIEKKKHSSVISENKINNLIDNNKPFKNTKAGLMARELIGAFEHPYSSTQTVVKDKKTYCVGNLSLSYLNIAYNKINYASVKNLNEVLKYQRTLKMVETGLVKVVIEGNNIPVKCDELDSINVILNAYIDKCAAGGGVKPTRARTKSVISRI